MALLSNFLIDAYYFYLLNVFLYSKLLLTNQEILYVLGIFRIYDIRLNSRFYRVYSVSSTAHLKVISLFFGIDDPGPSLSAIIQLGSVLALIYYFKNDFFKFKKYFSKKFWFSYT